MTKSVLTRPRMSSASAVRLTTTIESAAALLRAGALVAFPTASAAQQQVGVRAGVSGDPDQFVARAVTVVVVDEFEPVEVDEQHGGGRPARLVGLDQRPVEPVHQFAAVGQTGERINLCLVLELYCIISQ